MAGPFFDHLETRDPEARELALFGLLPGVIARAIELAPGWASQLEGVDPLGVTDRAALARLPVLRKSALPELQQRARPFAGLAAGTPDRLARIFMSPGPIYEPQGVLEDSFRSARALFAAGLRRGDIVLNTFSYHLAPGGWIMDAGARALGCAVIPAGPGPVELQLDAIEHLRPVAFMGMPEHLKALLDRAAAVGRKVASLKRALVSGGVVSTPLRRELAERGIAVHQAYATADVGVIAYESAARAGLIVDEGVIVEIVRPGGTELVAEGEIGEVVVTSFNRDYPMIRLATGDLSAVMPGPSPCGRTNMRIQGWLGRCEPRPGSGAKGKSETRPLS